MVLDGAAGALSERLSWPVKGTWPVAAVNDSGDPYLDQFIHGRATGPIKPLR